MEKTFRASIGRNDSLHTSFIIERERARFTGRGKALKTALRCPGVRRLCGVSSPVPRRLHRAGGVLPGRTRQSVDRLAV